MSLDRIAIPTPTAPGSLADYQAILAQALAQTQAFTGREIVDGSTIRAGTSMLIGGVLYQATSDTAITGSASNYVKITPSGATASAAFVANLTGVTFNEAYGAYYDGSGNLHVFDEGRAVATGVITAPRTWRGLSAGPRKRTFTANGTFVVPPGVTEVWVTGCAAGGNGGAGSGGGGGGGGGQGRSVIRKSIPVTAGASITVTIGAVGVNTTFGGLLTLAFGANGATGATGLGAELAGNGSAAAAGSAAFGFGGKGGTNSSGGLGGGGGGAQSPLDLTVAGANGTNGVSGGGAGGTGGNGGAGGAGGGGGGGGGAGGGTQTGASCKGGDANGYGAGGGGGGNNGGTGGSGLGGAGGPGLLIVEW
jgi:hypothetical protein